LKEYPEIEQLSSWKSSEEFLNDRNNEKLDILFLDIMLPGLSGIEVAKRFSEINDKTHIIMLTNVNSDEQIFDAIKSGAIGYILKSELFNLRDVIKIVMHGGAVITPSIAVRVFNQFRNQPKDAESEKLTKREKEILELLTTGISPKDAAKKLGIAENTLRNHIKNIYKKLKAKNKVEMMLKAADLGLLKKRN
jgi:DNA-binding NarL/FixJ family response regulator